MKIAVPYMNETVFQHFGKSEFFKIYEVSGRNIISSEIFPTHGSGHNALAGFLESHQVNTVICGGIGQGAISALGNAQIAVVAGAMGNCDEVVAAFITGRLITNDIGCGCDHHHEGHGCGKDC